MGVPYVPVFGLVGSDLLKRRDDMIVAPDPFGSGKVSVVAKAMRPDVAVFHAHKADRHGWCDHPSHTYRWERYPCSCVRLADMVDERTRPPDAAH